MINEYPVIGRVAVTVAAVREALVILLESAGVMIKQPLARAGNPLAGCDYHALADAELEQFPKPQAGTRHGQAAHGTREDRRLIGPP